ncbi:MAG: hypothetical protein WCV83_00640 [Candidatus Magasanikbacteria bacterium]
MENTGNKFCQWCHNPKNWLYWLIGAVVLVLVFCAGMASGRFAGYHRGEQYGFNNQKAGFNQMMRGRGQRGGERNFKNFQNGTANCTGPVGQNIPVLEQNIPAPTTTIPANQ